MEGRGACYTAQAVSFGALYVPQGGITEWASGEGDAENGGKVRMA